MEGAHNVIITVEEVFLVVTEGNLAAAVLGEEHSLALLHGAWANLTVVQSLARSNSDDDTEIELFLLALGEEDTALGLGEGLGLLDEDAVHEGTQLLECDHLCLDFSRNLIK